MYYFEIDSGNPEVDITYVWICPKDFFDTHGHMDDNHSSETLMELWPDHFETPKLKGFPDFNEEAECYYSSLLTSQEVRDTLIHIGFEEKKMLETEEDNAMS